MKLENHFSTRPLRDDEMSEDAPNRDSHLRVIEPTAEIAADQILGSIADMKSEVIDAAEHQGALLFRNCNIKTVDDAEKLILDLGIKMDDQYLGGASPRSSLTKYMFCSTEAPSPYIISQHTEMCYLRSRPNRIVFYCMTEPEKFGETPVFDTARMYETIDPSMRDRLESQGLIYERQLPKDKKLLNVYKTWSETFRSDDKEIVEQNCRKQGLNIQWKDNDWLVTQAHMPAVMVHPQTGRKCLSLTLYNEFASSCDMRKFSHRYNPILRLALGSFSNFMFGKKNTFFRTLWGDGQRMTREETQHIIDTVWRCSTLFRWQKGDLLILDNILSGHGRLNVVPPRKIAAALCDPYEVDNFATPSTA